MAKPIRFIPVKTKHGWRLNIPPKLSESGKRERHFFPKKKLADAAGDDLKSKIETFGIQARAISPSLAEKATIAAALLEPYGVDILEAAKIVAATREKEKASQTLDDAEASWRDSYKGLRPKTKENYKSTTDLLSKKLGGRLLATITAEELQAAIAPKGTPQPTAAGRIRNAKAFWNYSAGKGWCVAETFKGVVTPPKDDEHDEIGFLTPEATECLLRVAEEHFPKAVSTYAIQFFGGVRVAESGRLEEEHADLEGIQIPKGVAKKKARRHITPNETLATWLKYYPFKHCKNWREVNIACRRLAGWSVQSKILNDRIKAGKMMPLPKPTRGIWPQNAIRHSHATYAIASGMQVDRLLFEFGHSGDVDLLKSHYAGRASKKQALVYYAIAPNGQIIEPLDVDE